MELITASVFISILTFSLILNVFFYLKITTLKETIPTLTKDAQKLLSEISSGQAVLKIDVIDPGDILIRSPRS